MKSLLLLFLRGCSSTTFVLLLSHFQEKMHLHSRWVSFQNVQPQPLTPPRSLPPPPPH